MKPRGVLLSEAKRKRNVGRTTTDVDFGKLKPAKAAKLKPGDKLYLERGAVLSRTQPSAGRVTIRTIAEIKRLDSDEYIVKFKGIKQRGYSFLRGFRVTVVNGEALRVWAADPHVKYTVLGLGESLVEADADIRDLERQAAHGDPDAARALLRARQRTGYAVYGFTQSNKPMHADSGFAGSRSQKVVISPWLEQSVAGWSAQDIADAYEVSRLYSKKRAKDKRWGTRGRPDKYAPETLGFTKQSSALSTLLRQHPDVVEASAKYDRPGFPGSGIGHAAVDYTDKAKRHYKSFFRKAPGKNLYMQPYFGGDMTEAKRGGNVSFSGTAYDDVRDKPNNSRNKHPLALKNLIRKGLADPRDVPDDWYADDAQDWYIGGGGFHGPYSSKGAAAESLLKSHVVAVRARRMHGGMIPDDDPRYWHLWEPSDSHYLTIIKPTTGR